MTAATDTVSVTRKDVVMLSCRRVDSFHYTRSVLWRKI